MNPKVYIDTSVISYLVSKPSRDIVILSHQQLTQEWWEHHRSNFDLYISELVIKEASQGDADEIKKRLDVANLIQKLEISDKAKNLSERFLKEKAIPEKASNDALHIAIATIYNMDYISTWNLKHIGNINMRKAMLKVCRLEEYELPIVATPEEFLASFGGK